MSNLIYLAVPYSHPNPEVRKWRFEQANKLAAEMMNQGRHVFSSISHSHPIAEAGGLPVAWAFWKGYDTAMLANCYKLVVYCLPGWEESQGVKAEIKLAAKLGLAVEYIHP